MTKADATAAIGGLQPGAGDLVLHRRLHRSVASATETLVLELRHTPQP